MIVFIVEKFWVRFCAVLIHLLLFEFQKLFRKCLTRIILLRWWRSILLFQKKKRGKQGAMHVNRHQNWRNQLLQQQQKTCRPLSLTSLELISWLYVPYSRKVYNIIKQLYISTFKTQPAVNVKVDSWLQLSWCSVAYRI